jgi:hypothetical protein
VDFVIVGFGLGAVMMLLGFALRDLGPWLFGTSATEPVLPEFEAIRTTIRKQTLASVGTGIATAGTGLSLVTFAALLARTEDELGTIVVGMSLALAAVGVGAWTYDTIRRYRAAMDMVANQEQAIVAKLAPAPTNSRRPSAPSVSTRSAAETVDSKPEVEKPVAEPNDPDVESFELDHDFENATGSDLDPTEVTNRVEAEQSSDDAPLDLTDFEAETPEWPPSNGQPLTSPDERVGTIADQFGDDVLETQQDEPVAREKPAFRWTPKNRSSPANPVEAAPVDFTELPPLPEELTDSLIEESVRFDQRPSANRNVPSWLFEDLETDLAPAGPSRVEDPLDQFRTSQPVSRGSALDRILSASDEAPSRDAESDEPDESTDKKKSD